MTVQNDVRESEAHGRRPMRLAFLGPSRVMGLSDRIKKLPFTPLQVAVHVYAWQGPLLLVYGLFTNQLTANPLQAIQQRTGRQALALLVLSLACTPVNTITGWREPLKRSRTLGLYAFMIAFLHVLVFLDLDNGIAWNYFIQTVIQKWYIIFGMLAFLMLIPLAVTSFDIWKSRLGRKWKLLHRSVYIIVPIVILHYALSVKGDIFQLRGAIAQPLNYLLVVVGLLFLRLPFVRRFLIHLRGRLGLLFARLNAQATQRP
ncbi:MAG TPA: protein-methionine-sulfoxide reductase heme-binding subunit MsrQ [Anaerolineales bacterium]|nr:protein-methionine-sulfoxide reductase heme-binding subunit MsrQ [Anaerolineales bacterium]